MYKDNKILCVIPARGRSMGLPGKNIKKLLGKPLINYSIEHAKKSKYIDRVIVSTDDAKIMDIAVVAGAEVPFLRPDEFAGNNASTIDVLLHAIDWIENNEDYDFNILILLHVTTPLRSIEDVDNCIKLLVEKDADNVFSVTEGHKNPYYNMVEVRDQKIRLVKEGNFVSRQTAPEVFDMNSSIYVWWIDILKESKTLFSDKTHIYKMPRERSVDIDELLDFKIAEMILKIPTK